MGTEALSVKFWNGLLDFNFTFVMLFQTSLAFINDGQTAVQGELSDLSYGMKEVPAPV